MCNDYTFAKGEIVKTFQEQIESHLKFLKEEGLQVASLDMSGRFVRCCAIGETGRGNYTYKCWCNQMNGEKLGVVTFVRGLGGKTATHKTYGMSGDYTPTPSSGDARSTKDEREAEERARKYFEMHSSTEGWSPYLDAKKIKPYGIRFHKNDEFGIAIVVPARGIDGKIKNCQNINEDGSKRWLKGGSIIGAFHALTSLCNQQFIGICEGYATAATCMEALEGLPIAIVCAFDASNLKAVGQALKKQYPESKFVFFADDDRHLEIRGLLNKGLEAARIASNEMCATTIVAYPKFLNSEPLKALSDWNDLGVIEGLSEVRRQVSEKLGIR